jgi:hypothetical protein
MPIAVVPQLDINAPVAENNSDKMVSLLKFLMFNPGWISSWYDEHLLSMRQSMAKYTEDSSTLVPALQEKINDAIHHFYPDYHCSIEVIRDQPNDPNYTMDIAIRNSFNELVIQLDRVRKDESGLFVIRTHA